MNDDKEPEMVAMDDLEAKQIAESYDEQAKAAKKSVKSHSTPEGGGANAGGGSGVEGGSTGDAGGASQVGGSGN